MKLNLGCGRRKMPGWVNVDNAAVFEPDVLIDLEQFPWPWADGTVSEILLQHVLEHLGAQTSTYLGIIKEMWRVCRNGATVTVIVPHPRHDDFLHDPTHVRPVTAEGMSMFSRTLNLEWQARRLSNTPLALVTSVDFNLNSTFYRLDEPWLGRYQAGELTHEDIEHAARTHNNVVKEITIVLTAVKPE